MIRAGAAVLTAVLLTAGGIVTAYAQTQTTCKGCNGQGWYQCSLDCTAKHPCLACEGSGQVSLKAQNCNVCGGKGWSTGCGTPGCTKKHRCNACDGRGRTAIDPSAGAQAAFNRGNVAFDKKDFDEAIAEYTESIELEPNNANAFNARGAAYAIKRRYDEAIADFKAALKIDPNHADAKKMLKFAEQDKAKAR
ncbi:MAG: tetratricopeptide repeat protein [Chitinispirillia bacterium]|nr:tetratricopeptide repeat protein [Chitinispirillia bacterium]MCL2241085.1 tetratricopeptide repeat protein [Chitinispirillia bacterium]